MNDLQPMYGEGGVAQRRPDLFPSDPSARNFQRQFGAELVKDGAIAFHRGRWWTTPTFEESVGRIVRARSLRAA